MTYFVYVLRSERDGRCYTGITDNPERRLRQHNKGNSATPSTKNRGPFVLMHKERVANRCIARKREKYLKSGIGREFLKKKYAPL
ncbi:MAG: GIY-YIG nuclease family protein [Candidatus Wildermuthbacteria bacterium]|nr:GIY-YIG nuclease family protein [Candidatus Wildermuthbacteria bacterium]